MRIVKYISRILLIVLLFVFAFFAIIGKMGYKVINANDQEGVSKDKSLCFVDTNVGYNDITKKDTVVFKDRNGVYMASGELLASDDSVLKSDPDVSAGDVSLSKTYYVGVIAKKIPAIGGVANIISSVGFLIASGVVFVLCILVNIFCFFFTVSSDEELVL